MPPANGSNLEYGHTATARAAAGPALRPNSVAFANRDSALAISCDDGSIGLWDFRTGKERVRLQGPTGFSAVSQVSPDGSTLAGSTAPGTIALWNCDSGTKRTVAPLFDSSKVTILRFSASGEFLAVGTDDGMISLWQTQAGGALFGSASSLRGRCRMSASQSILQSLPFNREGI